MPLSAGRIGNSTYWNCLVFQKEFIIEDNPTIYTSPSLCEDQSLVRLAVVHYTCPMISLPCHIHFSSSTLICFKNRMLSLYFSRESHAETVFFFFHLIYVETKHQRNEHKQASVNDFQHSIWIF